MAERRMFAKTIVLSDAFLDMPLSARCLYFTLGMFADDDGFVNSPKGIMRQAGCSEDDMKVLLAKKFLLAFESGVIVIKHWRINNYLQKDRYIPTKYGDEKAKLTLDENMAYREAKALSEAMYTQDMYTQDRLGKDSKDKVTKEMGQKRKAFTPPTLEDVRKYAYQHCKNVDPDHFYAYFSEPNDNGETWVDSKGNKVRNWKQKMLTWEKMQGGSTQKTRNRNTLLNYDEKGRNQADLEEINLDLNEL